MSNDQFSSAYETPASNHTTVENEHPLNIF